MSEYYSGDYQNNDHQYSEYEHDGWKTTPYEAYENMPVFLRLGFAFGIFEKNTIFRVK